MEIIPHLPAMTSLCWQQHCLCRREQLPKGAFETLNSSPTSCTPLTPQLGFCPQSAPASPQMLDSLRISGPELSEVLFWLEHSAPAMGQEQPQLDPPS